MVSPSHRSFLSPRFSIMPSPQEWESHRVAITNMYQGDSLVKMMEDMKKRGFHASKAKYELQLKKWNLRKNLKKKHWKAIFTKYDQLVSQHGGTKNVRVLISGVEVSQATMNGRRRYSRKETSEVFHEAVCIEVQIAPGQWVSHTMAESIAGGVGESHEEADFDVQMALPDLPPPTNFTVHEPNRRFTEGDIDLDLAQFDFCPLIAPELYGALMAPVPQQANQLNEGSSLFFEFPSSTIVNSFNGGWSIDKGLEGTKLFLDGLLRHSPFYQFERTLFSSGIVISLHLKVISVSDLLQFSMRMDSLRVDREVTTSWMSTGPRCNSFSMYSHGIVPKSFQQRRLHTFQITRYSLQHLLNILPGAPCSIESSWEEALPRSLLFSFVNNFAGMEGIDTGTALKFLLRFSKSGTLSAQFASIPNAYSKAMVQNLLKACIEAQESQFARQLLHLNLVDVNKVTCLTERNRPCTALERAAELHDLEMVKVLLQAKANPNESIYLPKPFCGALSLIIDGLKSGTTVDTTVLEISRALLDYGAQVHESSVAQVINYLHGQNLACELMASLLRADHEKAFSNELLFPCAQGLDQDLFATVFNVFLKACATADHSQTCRVRYAQHLHKALVERAKKGDLQFVKYHLSFSVESSELFCAAIRSGNAALVDLVQPDHMRFDHVVRIDRRRPGDPCTTPLAEAIRTGNNYLIEMCKNSSPPGFPERGQQFSIALDAAASSGQVQLVEDLLRRVPHPEPQELGAALVHAVEEGHDNIAVQLLKHGADVNYGGGAALRSAIKKENVLLASKMMGMDYYPEDGLIQTLISLGDRDLLLQARDTFPLTWGGTISSRKLMFSDCSEDFHQFLLDNGFLGDELLAESLYGFAQRGKVKLAQQMLERGADPRLKPFNSAESSLEMAAASSPEMLNLLLQYATHRPLSVAQQLNMLERISWGTKEGLVSLKVAISSGMCNILSKRRAPIVEGFYMEQPLAWAIENSHKDPEYGPATVDLLLKQGIDPNDIMDQSFEGNKTALLLAVETKSLSLVQLILDSGADLNWQTKNGVRRTPLQKAAELGCYDIVCFFLERDADVHAPPARRSGGTALQLAASSGNVNVAAELLKRGARMDAKPSILGRWPLEAAAEHGRLAMIEFLWKANCGPFDEKICDRAIELAERNRHPACRELINELRMGTTPGYLGDMPSMPWERNEPMHILPQTFT